MSALGHFLAMGGYALFVWGAYGVSFALIALEIVQLVIRARRKSAVASARPPTVRAQYRGTMNEQPH
jgi:heme exporter protein CcmD